MMTPILENDLYIDDIRKIASLPLDWGKLSGKSILLSGGTGMIGRAVTDIIMYRNKNYDSNCIVTLIGRDRQKFQKFFAPYTDNGFLYFVEGDVNKKLEIDVIPDYVIHAASNTHPLSYSSDPVGTIMTNIVGTNHMLEYAQKNHAQRCVFLSSVEIYGENRGDIERFNENYLGYIDCNTLRAGYPESKRAGEALCQAYIKAYGMDIVIPRLSRAYGPTMLSTDSKAIAQFIKKGISGQDIVLKSAGDQFYSYTYSVDAAYGILTALLHGKSGEAYNISDYHSEITLRELAEEIAGYCGLKVILELPDEQEKSGYSTATKAVLEAGKISDLGWQPFTGIREGVRKTIDILR